MGEEERVEKGEQGRTKDIGEREEGEYDLVLS